MMQQDRVPAWPRDFEGFLDGICIIHPQGKHKTREYNQMQSFTDEVLKLDKKHEDPKGDFPKARKEVNYFFGELDSYESKKKQKLIAWEVMAIVPATPST
jgi:hypothetical protein